jgi:endonuclease-3
MRSNLRRSNRLPTSRPLLPEDESPVTADDDGSSRTSIASFTSSSNKRIKLELLSSSPVRPDPSASSSTTVTVAAKKAKPSQRPTPEECAYVVQELGKLHPNVLQETNKRREQQMGSYGDPPDILDGVVETMLSQNTTSANSTRAFANLKKAFPKWDQVVTLNAPTQLEEAIHCGGLAKIKAERIMNICQTLQDERGSPSLEYLRDWSIPQIQKELMRFKGLGNKTVSCVLLFTLGREEFPVDTHVYRISKQLNWIPESYSRDKAYDYLNAKVPPPLKLDLHCLLIDHGRQCHRCAARGKPQFPPKDGSKLQCPLVNNLDTKVLFAVETKVILNAIKKET